MTNSNPSVMLAANIQIAEPCCTHMPTAVGLLQAGKPVRLAVGGSSMKPIIQSHQPVTLNPMDGTRVRPGDVVLAKVNGRLFLHLVKKTRPNGQVQIGNNRGGINGWTSPENIYGLVVGIH